MSRPHALGLVALVVLLIGCGGGTGLFATVPPPVEFAGSALTPGLIEIPAAGTYKGEVTVERVNLVQDSAGAWILEDVDTIDDSIKAQATIGSDASVDLRLLDAGDSLFTGKLKRTSVPSNTFADLTAYDGHKERFVYRYSEGAPRSFEIHTRARIEKDEKRYSFDRYKFLLRP